LVDSLKNKELSEMNFTLQSTLIAVIALSCGQLTMVSGAENANAKLNAAAHPGGQVPGDGSDGVGYTYDHVYDAAGSGYGAPDVGYNYYGHPGTGAATAALYPAPYPTPAIAGHTMYTYQPLMPHEHMYAHKRVYYTPYADPSAFYNDPYAMHSQGMGYNKTTVTWQSGSNHFAPSPVGIYALQGVQSKLDYLKYKITKIGCNSDPSAGLGAGCLHGHCPFGHCR
jgi:hypothetical protein